MSTSATNTEALIRKYVALLNEHKFDDIPSLASPSATWWTSGLKEQNPYAGDKPFEQRIKDVLSVPEAKALVIDIVDLVVDKDGQNAVLEVVSKIDTFKNEIIMVFAVKDGKIESVREYMDFYPIQKALKEKEEREAKK